MHYIQERGSTHVYKINRISQDEIETMTGLCTHEQPPYCNAECPLKLDTKAMLRAAAQGDLKKALQIYEKIAPFPIILSSGCDAPCEAKCKLLEVGDGISIRQIEAAITKYGEKSRASGVFRMRKKKTCAILGSGLFALFLAGEIEKKAYPLTVFCEEADIKSYLKAAASYLKEEDFNAELERLMSKDIEFVFNSDISAGLYEETKGSFDILCASKEAALKIFPKAVCSEDIMLYEEEQLVMGGGASVLDAAFAAKKAALTVDRLAQNLDPRNTRGDEGPVETKLYTSLEGVSKLKRVEASGDAYTKEQAIEEAGRCIQCHCDECMKGCAYLRHYKKYPGLIAREIYNNTQIIMGDHQLNKPMNACTLCGQCTFTCPNGFDMAHVCKIARENMVSTDKMSLATHEFALMDMFFSNEDAFLSRDQPGFDKCRYVFFPGCQAPAIAPATVRAAYEDLSSRLEGGVALMLGCCGAIADWAGRTEIYDKTKDFIDKELAKLGDPIIIAGCPSCKKILSEHEGAKVIGIWDVLEKIGLPEGAKGLDRPAALHDSCGARGDKGTQDAIRNIAKELGCELIETKYSGDLTQCCGYGGLTAYANPEVAHEMAQDCLKQSDAPYISYCMACRDRFAREGHESKHILELVYGTDAGSPPDISEKRYNRLTLRNELLRDIWLEEVDNVKLPYDLEFTDEALKMMDERMILKSDVISVINAMRESGDIIEDLDTGFLITRCRLGNVTFWVTFTEKEGGYVIRRAYSHRMTVQCR
ncbi:MAG: pyridine nucleotide-disulfide oxidoreductase/dicluster-binding protein [Candidatus Limivicinus sp.]|jgi:Fe-S oxidoreductase